MAQKKDIHKFAYTSLASTRTTIDRRPEPPRLISSYLYTSYSGHRYQSIIRPNPGRPHPLVTAGTRKDHFFELDGPESYHAPLSKVGACPLPPYPLPPPLFLHHCFLVLRVGCRPPSRAPPDHQTTGGDRRSRRPT